MSKKDYDELLTEELAKRDIIVRAENASTMSQDDFKEIRFDGFGASDSSRIMNVNPFPGGSPQELLQDKIDRAHDETIGHKASVRMGRELEGFIIDKIMNLTELVIFKPSHMYGKEWNGLNTNFDGVLIEDDKFIAAEVKTISMYGVKYYDFTKAIPLESDIGEINEDFESELTNKEVELLYAPDSYRPEMRAIERHIHFNAERAGIPTYYYTQLQQQIDFLGTDYGYLFALNTKTWTIHAFKVARDEHTINSLNARAKKLYDKLTEARDQEVFIISGTEVGSYSYDKHKKEYSFFDVKGQLIETVESEQEYVYYDLKELFGE